MSNRCYMCKAIEEIRYNILLHCLKASLLWQLVFALFHVQWLMHSFVRGVLLSWNSCSVGKKGKRLGKLPHFALFGLFGRKGIRESLRIGKAQIKQSKVIFCVSFGIGLECTWGIVLLLL